MSGFGLSPSESKSEGFLSEPQRCLTGRKLRQKRKHTTAVYSPSETANDVFLFALFSLSLLVFAATKLPYSCSTVELVPTYGTLIY